MGLGILLIPPGQARAASRVNPDSIHALDKRFQQFSNDFYKQIIRQKRLPLAKFKSIAELKAKVSALNQSGKTIQAIALIHYNLPTIRSNIDALEVIPLTKLLLDQNDWHGASKIFNIARDEGGKAAASNISFVFAKYFMDRKNWQQVLEHLHDVINELSIEDANYAHLMIGTILQYQKRHREAVKYYQKIGKTSKYYPAAVLNTAVAYIRQDWWTDAYILIHKLIDKPNKQVNDNMVDRLNLVLGYALLRKEYFRNSRDAFRNVRLNSPYTNKALLGIALTAVNQEDFIGALNAITLLKEKKTTDLPVDEAYLLLPYTYGKLKQKLTASSAYSDAIKYYQQRIAELQQISAAKDKLVSTIDIHNNKTSIVINNNNFDYSRSYPKSFFENYIHLKSFAVYAGDIKQLNRKYQSLYADYNKVLANISQHLLAERIDYLESYLNQSRYGLARLYDSSLISTK